MGFSWSSFIGQSVMVGACKRAGNKEDEFLCDMHPVPSENNDCISMCTGDVLHFTRRGPAAGRMYMERLDEEWRDLGIQQHEGKAVYDGVLDGTGLGIDLVKGVCLGPHAEKLIVFLYAALDLFCVQQASPLEMSSFCGVLQWRRPAMSFSGVSQWRLSAMSFSDVL